MGYIVEAVGLFFKHKTLRRFIYQPLLVSFGVFVALFLLGYWLVAPFLRNSLSGAGLGEAGATLGTLVYIVLWLLVSAVSFLAVTSLVSSLAWDRLSGEVERVTRVAAPRVPVTRAAAITDSVSRSVLMLILGLAALACGFVVPVIGPICIVGFAGLLDFTASAFLHRGVLLGRQTGAVFRLRGWPGFLVGSGILTLIPILNVLCLPVLVAAGTLMVNRSETK